MTRLILTTDDSGAGCLKGTGLADIVIWFSRRFNWGPLPSDAELAKFLEARSTKHGSPGSHWLDFIRPQHLEEIEGKDLGLIDLCERCETIELWVDPEPNAQLTLIWLLDYLRHHGKTASKLTLVQSDVRIGNHPPEEVAKWRRPAVKILNRHLETASVAWQPIDNRSRRIGSTCSTRISASCRNFGKPYWNCSKNSPQTRRALERRKCGCWS
jgi:hypothetical protein